ncbi:hypothetical protein DFR70_11335 [Nocardia tenerifensis]|uniref:Uncharacterized protein n=1 Tax=Nocardia tenerifensis TaxID=228006 RepID=A0A318JTH5_9NOCA|nr:hypothetical protein [Nocardia tenerifensis]PXX58700.1 hypothetical protein DFR70_11335 [Nocardia tenerifensis]
MIYPGGDSASRVAQLANIAHESWMQDWPIEVSDPARLDEFVDLLRANKAEWELSFWLLDLMLASAERVLTIAQAQDDSSDRIESLVDALVAVWEATQAPGIAQRFVYWGCLDARAPDEMFRVSPLVRQARRRIGHR